MAILRVGGAAVVAVVAIVGIVFGATQLLDSSAQAADITTYTGEKEPIRVMELAVERVIDKGEGPMIHQALVTVTVMPADELPLGRPDVSGVLTGSDGGIITVGTGSIELDLKVEVRNDEEPQRTVTLTHSGPEVAVRLTHATVVYRDETPTQDMDSMLPEGSDLTVDINILVQQIVTLVDSMDEIGGNSEVQVWGSSDSNVVVAEVLVYRIVTD